MSNGTVDPSTTQHKAFYGLTIKEKKALFFKIRDLDTADEMTAYLQGVVDGRTIEAKRTKLPFGIKPR